MSFEGQEYEGAQKIVEKFQVIYLRKQKFFICFYLIFTNKCLLLIYSQSLEFKEIQHFPETMDFQPLVGGGTVIQFTGKLKVRLFKGKNTT